MNGIDRNFPRNRRRKGFQLLRPRHMLPVLLGAVAAAVVLHCCGFMFLTFWWPDGFVFRLTELPQKKETPDRIIMISREDPEDVKEKPLPEVPPEEPKEVETIEPQEIDIIDMPIEELTIAPGETNIPTPEPPSPENSMSMPEPSDIDLKPLIKGADDEPSSLPEIAPVTNNPIKVAAVDIPDNLDPSRLIADEIKKHKGSDAADVPGGSRSLGELIKLSNPGATAGPARLGADLLFAYNKAELRNAARISMLQLAALIHKNPETRFVIEGHTDSFGSNEYNFVLSLMRANAVRLWLKQNGVPLDRVYIRACWDRSPIVSTSGDHAAQAANRRVEIHLRKKGEKLPPECLSSKEVDVLRIDNLSSTVQSQLNRLKQSNAIPAVYVPLLSKKETAAVPAGGTTPVSGRGAQNVPAVRPVSGGTSGNTGNNSPSVQPVQPKPPVVQPVPVAVPVAEPVVDPPTAAEVPDDPPVAEEVGD